LSPGINFFGQSRSCNFIAGRFVVVEAVYGSDGSVQNFAANFVQHCGNLGPLAPALIGQIRYRSNIPLDRTTDAPAPFAFAPVVDTQTSTPYVSDAVVISGIATAAISITGGEYSLDGGVTFTSAPGTISGGQSVQVRAISAATLATSTYAVLTIGALSSAFRVTTLPGSTVLYFQSQAGDSIGGGTTAEFQPGNQYVISLSNGSGRNFKNGVSFRINGHGDSWTLDMGAAGSAPLVPGIYENATRFAFASGAGLDFSGAGGGCNTLTGRFEVLEAAYAANGDVLHFAANFIQHCEGGVPALLGQIRFQSSIPIDFTGTNIVPAVNVAARSNGGVASASSTYSACCDFGTAGANNGDRKGLNWGSGGGWNDATSGSYPDWLQITFSGVQSIGEIDVFTVQDNFSAPVDPTSSMTFTQYGITAFQVQYLSGSAWVDVPGGNVTGNNLVWRRFTFAPVSTSAIRVLVNASLNGYSRIVEVEAWTTP
jgi:hypothetical protein